MWASLIRQMLFSNKLERCFYKNKLLYITVLTISILEISSMRICQEILQVSISNRQGKPWWTLFSLSIGREYGWCKDGFFFIKVIFGALIEYKTILKELIIYWFWTYLPNSIQCIKIHKAFSINRLFGMSYMILERTSAYMAGCKLSIMDRLKQRKFQVWKGLESAWKG